MNSKTLYAAVLAAAIGSATAVAQGPTLLKNFNNTLTGNFYSGSSTAFAQLGTKAYITFTTNEHGNELWTYDAVGGGFSILTENADIPLPGGGTDTLFKGDSDYVGNARHQITYNGRVYFTAWTVDYGRELYSTDGTTAGTQLIKDIMPGNPEGGPFTTGPIDFIIFQGQLFFTADDGVNGRQMWKTDGTTAGTVVVDPLAPTMGTYIQYVPTPAALFFTTNSTLYYLTLSPDTITDVDSVNYTSVQYPAAVGNTLYFQAASTDPLDTIGRELYKSDGATISLCKDIMSGAGESSNPQVLTEFNGKLYFSAAYAIAYHTTWGFASSDYELYEYDPVGDALQSWNLNNQPGSTSYAPQITGSSYPSKFLENNNKLFFTADDGLNGTELWTVDTTSTVAMLDPLGTGEGIRPGTGYSGSASPNYLTVASSSKIIFVANDGTHGTEIWESDGTSAGTILGGDYRPGTSGTSSIKIFPTMGAGLCLFRGNNYNGWGTELHSYTVNTASGVAGTYQAIADVNPQGGRDGSGGFYNAEGVVDAGYGVGMFGAYAYDPVTNDPLGAELWRTDGTAAGTLLVKDIRVGSSGSNIRNFCQAGTLMYFQANDGTVGDELYFANGVPEGQPGHSFGLAADIKPGGTYDSGRPQYITYAGRNRIIFQASDGTLGTGYTAGLFWAVGNSFGQIVHYEDFGGGPVAVPCYSPESLKYHNGRVYFSCSDSDSWGGTYDLYNTDGTVANKLTDMAWQQAPAVVHFDDANQQVYILGYYRDTLGANAPGDTAFGYQLWVSDSAFANPLVRLTNEATVSQYGDPEGVGASYFAEINNRLFFRGQSLLYGGELWITDGTAAGTMVWADINPGTANSGYGAPYVIDAGMVFSANDGIHGEEMWLSDGVSPTAPNTAMIADTIPGTYPQGDGSPAWVVPVGSRRVAYRYGRYTRFGSELWTCDGTAPVRVSDINPDNGDSEVYSWTLQNGLLLFEAKHWQLSDEAYVMNFGANTKAFGVTSAPLNDLQHTTISCNDPVLGPSGFTIKGKGALAGSTCGLGVSFLNGEVVFQGLSIYVNLGTFQIAGFAVADASGNYTFPTFAYPNNPGYYGADLVYQAASLSPLGLFKSRLSNALYMNVDGI